MSDYWLPPTLDDGDQHRRRAGFELEFGNVTVGETARALQRRLGGTVEEKNPFKFLVRDCSLGDLRVERDASLLHSTKYREALSKLNIKFDPGTLAREIEHGIDRLSSNLIPCEIVTEPLAFGEFDGLDTVVEVLNELHAEGTQASLINAYGTHINPSSPDLEPTTVLAYLQGFLLFSDWIIDRCGIDVSRRHFTRFIDPFPDTYLDRVLDHDYDPEMATLIDDYLADNPTRNRALDLLPLLCEIDADRTLDGVDESDRPLIKPRPAFHYRLPDCRVGEPGWSVAREWNYWWHVEVLAADAALRDSLISLWQRHGKDSLLNTGNWVKRVQEFIDQQVSEPGS